MEAVPVIVASVSTHPLKANIMSFSYELIGVSVSTSYSPNTSALVITENWMTEAL